jgi:5-(carboxyamino)imidazole ribonucleotide synthase
VNEIAPRPHNTGHYTLDWGGTSQFEAHILSVLGEFDRIHCGVDTCMVNILGLELAQSFQAASREIFLNFPEARLHWYGKSVAKAGRKMGHINVSRVEDARLTAIRARDAFLQAWSKK